MAINVNTVYQTVLLILNKEQRGYITPNEFNKLATQVQLEIFEQYFEDLNQQLRAPGYQDEYADRVDNIEEKIAIFKTYGQAQYDNLTTPLTPFFFLPEDVHRIGTIMYKGEQEIQSTDRRDYLHLYMSKLTRPTTNYPMYIQEGEFDSNAPAVPPILHNKIFVYPETIDTDVSISYVRKPANVVWNFTTGSLGQYLHSTAAPNQDFEISNQEQTEVIIKILMYAGVVIRDPQIVQAAAAQSQAIEVNQKS